MTFWDSSALVPLLVEEPRSGEASKFLRFQMIANRVRASDSVLDHSASGLPLMRFTLESVSDVAAIQHHADILPLARRRG